ncbi:Uncharacterised protein [Chlamydia trachomatis]|nr:Uncharacterised protein [Chlamydia trachomatis]CRH47344.1 Uncharacterised protein [Chlamydia trachomatis]CRH55444.1 Uncharacterised protein [Chlamydia trachomatis]
MQKEREQFVLQNLSEMLLELFQDLLFMKMVNLQELLTGMISQIDQQVTLF